MKWIPHVGAAILLALFSVTTRLGAAGKINTSYISTSPGSSTVIWIAKDIRIFEKHGLDGRVSCLETDQQAHHLQRLDERPENRRGLTNVQTIL